MANLSTRERLTQAALELFLSQGVSQTTTRQIADQAGVNEATLFRNFGNKYGLLLAMLQDVPVAVAPPQPLNVSQPTTALKGYAGVWLQALEQFPRFIRSVIGEADHYSEEQIMLLKSRLTLLQQDMANHLERLLGDDARLSSGDVANCLAALLVGYVVIEATSGHTLWSEREDFLDALTTMFVMSDHGPPPASGPVPSTTAANLPIQDLPAAWVHQVIKQAKNISLQDQALALVLFGAGLRPEEIPGLLRSHHISDKSQHVLQVVAPQTTRQVPINQWILGKRYGSYTSNPLTKWLKTRKDSEAHLFVTAEDTPLSQQTLQMRWEQWWQGIDVGEAVPSIHQARQTWCVEMLTRGITLDNLSILAGCEVAELHPYAQRSREKSAIAAATQLDKKSAG